jgi:2-C-methyl-D-erythritol 4-phosphate cytidylyltransferase/2-C-methyl-D-erythritol 2,4-cyclodiphosphate synthase
MSVSAIVAAGGRGVRLGGDQPKQFLDLGRGETMIELSVEALLACAEVREVVVAVPAALAEQGSAVLFPRASKAHTAAIVVVPGGERRQDSVANAFARIASDSRIVVIHDAARPFASADLVTRTIAAARTFGAAVAAVPVVDTVKQARPCGESAERVVGATLPRGSIFLAQTPQAFQREILAQALASSQDQSVTDEAMLVERAGFDVHIVAGEAANIKVTTREDLEEARARMASRASGGGAIRIGNGYDLHRLVEDRALILAGVTIPFERGLLGHSDADIVCHAVTDAILGAANAGDIGRLFPDTDARWKDADSIRLLRAAVDVVRRAGFTVVNVDATVIAQRPKLLPYLAEMRANLAAAIGIDAGAVSIKGKTNEQVDATGRGEAMACHAVALLTL